MQVRKLLQNYFINNEEASGNISGAFFGLIENMNNKNSVKWNNDVQSKEFTASRINQITWDDASGRLKITLDGKTIAYIPVVYN